MSYLTIFGEKLDTMLSDLTEEKRKAVVSFVKGVVLESYRNGQKAGPRGKKQTSE